jgi:hypothetical protein
MLLSHVLASLCLYISSKEINSYIPNSCGTKVSSLLASFKWCHLLVISFPSGSSQCGTNKVERNKTQRYAMIKRLQVISTSGNATRTHLSFLLFFKLPPCMICSKLPFLANVCRCALDFHSIILCTHLAGA